MADWTPEHIEELRAAMADERLSADSAEEYADVIAARLTRPAVTFADGEIAAVLNGFGNRVPVISGDDGYNQNGKMKLTTDEAGAGELVEMMEKLASHEKFSDQGDAGSPGSSQGFCYYTEYEKRRDAAKTIAEQWRRERDE